MEEFFIKNIEIELDKCKNIFKDIEERTREIENYKSYVQIIKNITFEIIENVLPIIISMMNNILSSISETSIEIYKKVSNTKEEWINYKLKFMVNDQKGRRPIEMLSGSEKFIYSIVLRITLSKLTQMNSTNFLIIDEGWGNFDETNRKNIPLLFEVLKSEFKYVILISHMEDIKSMVEKEISIKMKEGYSNIKIV